jgi:short-subunit dehydrogenase
MSQEFRGLRVVITGASSGIGKAAARAFARRGADLVLAARRPDALQDTADECWELGGRAVAVPTDVTDREAVLALARRAEDRFGGVDVWINNAGTGVFGPFQNGDFALHRRTVEVNLFGTMHGASAVLPIFLRQRHGVLINNISIGGWAPIPFAAAYTASKFGLRGFTASLRQEMQVHRDIHVCGVFPAMIDTPGFVHGANTSGRKIDPGVLLYTPEDVADTMVSLVRHPRAEAAVGLPAHAARIAYGLSPAVSEWMVASVMRRALRSTDPGPSTDGAVMHPIPLGRTASGGYLDRKGMPSAGQISKGLGIAAVTGGLVLAGLALSRRRR